jgi:lysophospholipase L1-like esterase
MFSVKLTNIIVFLFLIQCITATIVINANAAEATTLVAMELQAIERNDLKGKIQLILPKNIYAVQGIESNIYFDNICLVPNITNYIFDVNCSKGIQQMERWTFMPSSADIGSYPMMIEVRDETNEIIARASTVVRVIPKEAGAGQKIKMLLIGDSLTHASIYSQHILDLCRGDSEPQITLLGSHVPDSNCPANRHEGYGGWTAKHFITYYTGTARTGTYQGCGSPFLYEDSNAVPILNFSQYCIDINGGKGPDFVTILLGANDVFSATDDNIKRSIDEMLVYYDKLIKMIHDFRSDIPIAVLLPVPPAATQDAFAFDYSCGQTRWQYKRNQHHLVEQLIKHYDNRESENISIVPTNVSLDCMHNYPLNKTICNARTSEQITRVNNALHPAATGYQQIGDALYCWLKHALQPASSN